MTNQSVAEVPLFALRSCPCARQLSLCLFSLSIQLRMGVPVGNFPYRFYAVGLSLGQFDRHHQVVAQ